MVPCPPKVPKSKSTGHVKTRCHIDLAPNLTTMCSSRLGVTGPNVTWGESSGTKSPTIRHVASVATSQTWLTSGQAHEFVPRVTTWAVGLLLDNATIFQKLMLGMCFELTTLRIQINASTN